MILKRGDKYGVKVYDPTMPNKQRWLGTFRTESLAKRKEAEWTLYRRSPAKMPFGVFADEWLGTLATQRPRTVADYTTTVTQLKAFFDCPIAAIDAKRVDAFVKWSCARYAPRSTRKQVTRLRQMMNDAVRWDYLPVNPVGKVRLPKVQRKQVVPLTPEEGNRLVESGGYWAPLLLLVLTSGLRWEEVFALRETDFDFTAGTVTVAQGIWNRAITDVKSDAARRTIPLPTRTLDAVKEYLETAPANPWGVAFPNRIGRLMAYKTWSDNMVRIAEKAGLPHVRLHDLRHCYASLLIREGCTPKVIQYLMGHSSITVTYDTYGHLFPDDTAKAAKVVGAYFGGAADE